MFLHGGDRKCTFVVIYEANNYSKCIAIGYIYIYSSLLTLYNRK